MRYSLEMLVRDQDQVVDYYKAAASRWQEIWTRAGARDLAKLAESRLISLGHMLHLAECEIMRLKQDFEKK